jgi:hypothetical protein
MEMTVAAGSAIHADSESTAPKSCSGVAQHVQGVGRMSMEDVSLAIVKFLGYGIEPYPKEDLARIEKEFGSERAPALEARMRPILSEFAALKPDWSRHSLAVAAEWAGQEMKRRYPGLSEECIQAMAWIFAWRWK